MEATAAVERRQPRETALQRLARQMGEFGAALGRLTLLAAVLTPILLMSFLTVDLPMHALDGLFGSDGALKPSNWLTRGGFVMMFAPLIAMLFARKYGGDEASRVITAAWGLAALAVFAELSYLTPTLVEGDMPSVRFTVLFVSSAMAGQYFTVSAYDILRGGARWWRAPLIAALSGYGVQGLIYFPGIYLGADVPWLNWMVGDFAIKAAIALGFLSVYAGLRKTFKPKGGFGGG